MFRKMKLIRFFQLDSLPHFEFLNKQKIDTTNTGTGTVLSQVIRITSFDSGHWVIPSLYSGKILLLIQSLWILVFLHLTPISLIMISKRSLK